MDDRVKYSLLLDIYGELLTAKQKNILIFYYNEDLSLAEISEHTNTSRQAVHDIIKRCNKLLSHYDEKLQLLKRQIDMQHYKEKIIVFVDKLSDTSEQEEKQKLVVKIKDCIDEFI